MTEKIILVSDEEYKKELEAKYLNKKIHAENAAFDSVDGVVVRVSKSLNLIVKCEDDGLFYEVIPDYHLIDLI